jgi:hypothetical protein
MEVEKFPHWPKVPGLLHHSLFYGHPVYGRYEEKNVLYEIKDINYNNKNKMTCFWSYISTQYYANI